MKRRGKNISLRRDDRKLFKQQYRNSDSDAIERLTEYGQEGINAISVGLPVEILMLMRKENRK